MNWKGYFFICVIAAAIGVVYQLHKPVAFDEKSIEPVTRINETTVALTKEALANISTAIAKIVDFPDRLDLMGRVGVTEDRTTVVPARVAGRTEAVYVASGEKVEKGQLLVSLFSPDFVAAREEYLQSLSESKPTSPDAADFMDLSKMARKKLKTMGLNEDDINQLKPTKETNLYVRAPRTGFLITKNAVIGNLVNVGDTLFTIADISKVWFTGDLYPEDLTKVHKGQDVQIDAVDGEKIYGKVSFISPIVDPNARTIKIRALMENPKLILKADMYVQGSLVLEEHKQLAIPTRALTRLGNTYSVFRRISQDQFQRVTVEIGAEEGDLTVIRTGLKEGDEIVSDGSALLLNATLNTASR